MKKLLLICILFFLFIEGFGQGVPDDTTNYLTSGNWDDQSLWNMSVKAGATALKTDFSGLHGDGIAIAYTFPNQTDWFDMNIAMPDTFSKTNCISFFIKSSLDANDFELKFTDKDGSTFRRVVPLGNYTDWEHVVIYLNDMEYVWGGDATFDQFSIFSIAASGIGSGTIWIDEVGIGKENMHSTFPSIYDPDSTLEGIGFAQRRDSAMHPEDSLVLKYLKVMQDISSSAMDLIPSQEGDQGQTFNNALCAMAFIAKDERERAERILDYYANATDPNNTNKYKQIFYCEGQPRGFYQNASISTRNAYGHRWIGDMAWLFFACKNYEYKYNSSRYDKLIIILKDMFELYYRDYPTEGYVATGWRDGDTSFDTTGHHEGNIDCYVVFKLLGDNYRAQKIKTWVENQLAGQANLPLDLYTWRTLAFGKNYINLLNIPEYNYNYRKVIEVNGENVMGMFSSAASTVSNFWNDGTGHISCAYQAFGDTARGYFYANQMDALIIPRIFGTDTTHTIPYTLNREGGYEWVNTTKGFSSTVAWYILAKNACNPFLSDGFVDTVLTDTVRYPAKYYPLTNSVENRLENGPSFKVYPNPFTISASIDYFVEEDNFVHIDIYDINGRQIVSLVDRNTSPGNHSVTWNGESYGAGVSPGIYLVRLLNKDRCFTRGIMFQGNSR